MRLPHGNPMASIGDIGTFSEEPLGWLTSAKFDYVRAWKSR